MFGGTKKQICPVCQHEISVNNYDRHVLACQNTTKPKVRGIDYDPNHGFKNGTRSAWNKGLTKEDDARIMTQSLKQTGRLGTMKGRKHTDTSKKKMSENRIKFLRDNPDKVPYKLNHYSKGSSYAETYWRSILDENRLVYKEQYCVGLYRLDFAFPEILLDLEIDGDQHYLDERVLKSDERRTAYLTALGWTTIRVKWSDFQRLTDKTEYVNIIMNQIWTCHPSGEGPGLLTQ